MILFNMECIHMYILRYTYTSRLIVKVNFRPIRFLRINHPTPSIPALDLEIAWYGQSIHPSIETPHMQSRSTRACRSSATEMRSYAFTSLFSANLVSDEYTMCLRIFPVLFGGV